MPGSTEIRQLCRISCASLRANTVKPFIADHPISPGRFSRLVIAGLAFQEVVHRIFPVLPRRGDHSSLREPREQR